MAKPDRTDLPPQRPPSTAFAAILAWVLPGLGHWWIGERARGLILFIVVTVTFWGGVAVAGIRSTVTPKENGAWIAAQLCLGPQAFVAMYLSDEIKKLPNEELYKASWPASTIGVVYAGVAGLLNLLIIIDVLARVETVRSIIGARSPPRKGA
ncbi:MAG TPA: DUF6677 family protein [Phycisphaerae bacterium]|nr:DUF6677 family protein [Phycisphaerae bacterium]